MDNSTYLSWHDPIQMFLIGSGQSIGYWLTLQKDLKKGVVTVTLYQKPLVKSIKDLTRGSHVYSLLLPYSHRNKNVFSLPIKIKRVDGTQALHTKVFISHSNPHILAHLPTHSIKKQTKRKPNPTIPATSKADRAVEYQTTMDKNGWSRSDLAGHLKVSRAWITISMKYLPSNY